MPTGCLWNALRVIGVTQMRMNVFEMEGFLRGDVYREI